jgi:hypothetical protein
MPEQRMAATCLDRHRDLANKFHLGNAGFPLTSRAD